ncbi:antifreeze protein [Aliigemmobacter aestuarii]|uniref:Antifreeze protein n=1 Tax=Aliigemmobacter aestuarii TaxID=1445661 RepID=A0A4V3V0L5_9RHOB|nr:antifreeze protein [Gemmobacter aestuarii]THD84442.1 antifreeze protein [Gemmobacter aestuarii]
MFFNPMDYLRPMAQLGRIAAEAHTVIALRMAGFAGIWPMHPDEAVRMVSEKVEAGHDSVRAAMVAGLNGRDPAEIAMAAIRPVRRHTRANARRLKDESSVK